MEEDLKKAKEFFYRKYTFMGDELSINISTILNRLEQDEKVIEEMAIELNNRDFGFDYGIADEDLYDGIIDHFRKKCE